MAIGDSNQPESASSWRGSLWWGLLVFAAVLPIGLLGLYSFLVTADAVRKQVRIGNESAASFGSQLVSRAFDDGLTMARTAAGLPLVSHAMTRVSAAGPGATLTLLEHEEIRRRLAALVDFSGGRIDRAYLVKTDGTVICEFPATDSEGKSVIDAEWFGAEQVGYRTLVSGVDRRANNPNQLAVSVVAPIHAESMEVAPTASTEPSPAQAAGGDGSHETRPPQPVVGLLVTQYRLDAITEWLRDARVGTHGYAFVLDPNGVLVAHPERDPQARRYVGYAYTTVEDVLHDPSAKPRTLPEYRDPLNKQLMLPTVWPVDITGRRWLVVAEQPVEEAYAPISQAGWQIVLAFLVLALTAATAAATLGIFSSRNQRLAAAMRAQNRQLQGFEAIVQASNDAILSIAPDGTMLSWNTGAQAIYGYSSEQCIAQNVSMLASGDDSRRLLSAVRSVANSRAATHLEQSHVRQDGQRIDVSLTLSPVRDVAGMVSAIAAIARDVTLARRAMKQQEQFYNLSLEMLCIARFDGYFAQVNPAWERTLGYASPELLARPFLSFVHPDDREATRKAMETLDRGEALTNFENRYLCKDGTYKWLLWSAAPLANQGLIFAAARDVTERKQTEAALAASADALSLQSTALTEQADALIKQAEDLSRSNAELEQFAYVASHDLQEPLRMVSSYLQLIERRYEAKLDTSGKEFIRFAVDGAQRMKTLIEDLLSYARVGTRASEFETVDLRPVLERVRRNLKVAIEESGVEITAQNLPTIVGDPTQLTQLIQNLVANAIKFRGAASPRVRVGAQRNAAGWTFSVEDNGIGIDPKYFDRIFMIFQRLHGRGAYSGNGIGLAVCKKIVERHGGRIWVVSTPGAGSTFYFTIPDIPLPPLEETGTVAANAGRVAAVGQQIALLRQAARQAAQPSPAEIGAGATSQGGDS